MFGEEGRGKGVWRSDYKVLSTVLEHLDLILKAMVTPLRILIPERHGGFCVLEDLSVSFVNVLRPDLGEPVSL